MVQIVAHRGSSGDRPENTLPAFAEAVRVKADIIELDVHLSKDGYLIDPVKVLKGNSKIFYQQQI